jgi:DNA-binding beta-propeller fold protein YncE
MSSEYLFPARLTRRDFFKTTGATAAAAAMLPAFGRADDSKPAAPVTIGTGKWTYTLDPEWGKLPTGMSYGYGCALIVDSQDRIFVTSRSASPCVAIFDRSGKLLETWSKEFAQGVGMSTDQVVATAHGLYWNKENDGEYLYWTENVAPVKGKPPIGARVYKTDMKGKVLYTLGNVTQEDSTSQKLGLTNPTDVAVAPNGDIYIVDGYGSQKVYRFDKNFRLLRTIGGHGKDHGLFNTCHGVWVSTLKKDPEVYIADRHNNRIEVFSPELDYKRTADATDSRMPCCFYQHEGHLYVPELGARVSIYDADDKPVARLGDGKGFEKVIEKNPHSHPDKFATSHALTVDSRGDMYVIEWLPYGRPRKFRHTPA